MTSVRTPRVLTRSGTASPVPAWRAPAGGAAPTRRVTRGVLAVTRVLAITAVLVLTALASASPAAALNRDDGDDPGPGLSILETVGLFVGIPLLLFVLSALYVYGPSSAKGPRYRPGVGWWAQPVWFTGHGRDPSGQPTGDSSTSSADGDRIAPAATGVSRSDSSVMSSGIPASAVTDSPSGASSLGDEGGGGRNAGHGGARTRTSPEGGASARW